MNDVRLGRLRDLGLTLTRFLLVLALVAFAAYMLHRGDVRDVDFDLIRPVLDRAAADDELMTLDENAFRKRFGLDPDGCEGWALYGSDYVMNVDELLVVKAPDEDVREAILEAARARRDEQFRLFRDYGTDQASRLESAILWQRGPYVFYGVSARVEDWDRDLLALIR